MGLFNKSKKKKRNNIHDVVISDWLVDLGREEGEIFDRMYESKRRELAKYAPVKKEISGGIFAVDAFDSAPSKSRGKKGKSRDIYFGVPNKKKKR